MAVGVAAVAHDLEPARSHASWLTLTCGVVLGDCPNPLAVSPTDAATPSARAGAPDGEIARYLAGPRMRVTSAVRSSASFLRVW